MIQITFYTKPQCPLCKEAEELLADLGRSHPINLIKVDILRDAELYTAYGERIPVLQFSRGVTLEPPITESRLRNAIRVVSGL